MVLNDGRRSTPWDQYRRAPAPMPTTPEAMRGICFCLLYDLCCWLATVRRPVPADVDEYTLTPLRDIGDPRQRLGRYVNPAILQSWARALEPFFSIGATLEPELGEAGSFQERGRDGAGRLRAELRFGNRSSVLDRSQRRHQLPPHDWILTVLISLDQGGFIENATIRRA
ncbi:MAG TPA: hypothetical protein VIC57_14785 [Candidatus Dormibacteraeota bacterium]|jgi:hypothetical protein